MCLGTVEVAVGVDVSAMAPVGIDVGEDGGNVSISACSPLM